LKASNINVDSMKKINDFKNYTWKVERVRKNLKKLNSFLDDAENAKNDANILKNIFFWIFDVFCYFWIFMKIYRNMGQKLGSNNLTATFV
jgi:hypothetical protein